MPDLNPGSIFAGHRIEGVAGRGGMGTVYRATHIALDHVVALKVISPDLAGDEAFRERFRSEIRIAVSLRHPNVVPIHHAGEEDGLLFVTMDLIDGPDLRRLLIIDGAMEPERASSLVAQVASALDVAHSRGLVHRDIKPGNVLVEKRPEGEHAYLTDFGLAKRFDQATVSGAQLTGTGAFVGTLDYVAPEQIRGDRVDARTDVYALGCVLYETLAGKPPFGDREENVAKIYAHLQDEPPWVPGEADGALDEVIGRALAKEPRERFPSAGDLARAAVAASSGTHSQVSERSVATGAAAPESGAPVAIPIGDTVEAAPPESSGGGGAPPTAPAEPAPTEPGEPPTGAVTERAPAPAPGGGPRWGRIAGALAAVAAVVVAVVLLAGGGGGGDGGSGGSAAISEPTREGAPADVAGFPVGVAVNGDLVTVASRDGTLASVGKESHQVEGTPFDLRAPAEDVVVDGSTAWVSLWKDNKVAEVSLDDQGIPTSVARTIDVGTEPRGMVLGQDVVWVANLRSASLTAIPKSGEDPTQIDLPAGTQPADVDFTADSLWVSDRKGNRVLKVTQATGEVTEKIEVGAAPKGIAVLDDDVWVANAESGSVTRISADGTAKDFEVGGTPRGVEAGFGRIWVANGGTEDGGDGAVDLIDPADPANFATVDIPGSPEEVAVGPNHVWVTTGEGDQVVQITP